MQLDSATAALIGAVIGAAATALVPLATLRATRREAKFARRRQETAATLSALVRLFKTRGLGDEWRAYMEAHTEAVVAVERLLLVCDRRDAIEVQRVTTFAFEAIERQENRKLVSASVEAMSTALRRWCRGEVRGKRISDAYGVALDQHLRRYQSEA